MPCDYQKTPILIIDRKQDAYLEQTWRREVLLSGKPWKSMIGRTAALLPVLASPVRVMSETQIGRTWFPSASKAELQAVLRWCEENHYVVRHPALVHPELPLSEPLARWSPGDAPPDAASVAYALQIRWCKPLVKQTVYTAARRTLRLYGGPRQREGRLNHFQLTHDLMVSALFLLFRQTEPDRAETWISEDLLPKRRGAKQPDALVQTNAGPLFIEFGGSYRAERLRKLHRHCASTGIAYEIW